MDNTKTWPEEIYLYGDMNKPYQEQTERLGWSEDNFNANVKYIRADLISMSIEKAIQEIVGGA